MSGGVFISYRREDAAGFAGRIYDRLIQTLGRESVFIDVDNIPAGLDFVDVLSERVGRCDALIAVIGRNWLAAADRDNRRRLDDPNDFVRIEIGSALERSVPVIPVLVDGAAMPNADDLPDGLKKLARRQGIEISHNRFDSDAERLTDALTRIEERARARQAGASDKNLGAAALADLSSSPGAGSRGDSPPAPARPPSNVGKLAFATAAILILLGLGASLLIRNWRETRAPAASLELPGAPTSAPAAPGQGPAANAAPPQSVADPSILIGASSKLTGEAAGAAPAASTAADGLAREVEQQNGALANASQNMSGLAREANAALQGIRMDTAPAGDTFANAAAPAPNAAANEAQTADSPPAKMAKAGAPDTSPGSQQWMNFEDFKAEYNRQAAWNYYPDKVLGRCSDGVGQRSVVHWSPRPAGQFVSLNHTVETAAGSNGAGEKDFKSDVAEMTAKGFTMKSDSAFQGCDGLTRHLTVWIKE